MTTGGHNISSPPSLVSTSRGVFSVVEFRVLWLAYAQSIMGDQLARVALSILVFTRTGSPAWTATTYALTYLPALVSGVLLSGLADRFPRRSVMIGADLTRATLVAVMALSGVPLAVLAGLLILVELAEAPFGAAQGAMLPAVLGKERYERGQRIILVTQQAGQVAGFAASGLLVAWLGTHLSLAVDAATFLVSAILVRLWVRARPATAPATASHSHVSLGAQVRGGARLIWADRRLRALVSLGWLAGFIMVPEGLAVPFAKHLDASAATVGFLLAVHPAGVVAGAFLLGNDRVGQQRRLRWLGFLAIGANLPLVFYLLDPNVAGALVLLAVSGICSAYQITAGATFVQLTPDRLRGQAFGLARSGLIAVQGIGITMGGLVAQWSGTAAGAIGVLGVVGTLCALAASAAWAHASPKRVAAALTTATTPSR